MATFEVGEKVTFNPHFFANNRGDYSGTYEVLAIKEVPGGTSYVGHHQWLTICFEGKEDKFSGAYFTNKDGTKYKEEKS